MTSEAGNQRGAENHRRGEHGRLNHRADAIALDLHTAVLIPERPGAEVLAVVRQDSIPAFTKARARTRHHFCTTEALRLASNPDAVAMRETLERNVLHRSAPQSVSKAGVVDDAAIADVDPMMSVENSRRDKMGCERRFVAGAQRKIAPACVRVVVCCITVRPPSHGKRRYAVS